MSFEKHPTDQYSDRIGSDPTRPAAHCTWRAHIGKNISVIFQMTSMEAYWVLTETGARSGEDDFVSLLAPSCNQCYYASSQVGDLRGHLITHSGEKSNKCNQCNNASLQAGNLNKHLKGTLEKVKQVGWHCYTMGPLLGTRVPMGTFLGIWVPIGSPFYVLGPLFPLF